MRLATRQQREHFQRRLLLASVAAVFLIATLTVSVGAYRELVAWPNESVAYVESGKVILREYTDVLTGEMQRLQQQASGAGQNPNSPALQQLIEAQEKLPETVLDRVIEEELIRQEAERRGIRIGSADIDNKINEALSIQRSVLNAPTPTVTETRTPTVTLTVTPEDWNPTPTVTPTATFEPGTPTLTPDPSIPTPTRTPFPTRLTATPQVTPTVPPLMSSDEFAQAYKEIQPVLKNEASYRHALEKDIYRERLRDSFLAEIPRSGPQARVERLVTSTEDEGKVAQIQLDQGFPFEELAFQANERPAQGLQSGDLGWVARGAEAKEFDDYVFNPSTPRNEWSKPFRAGNHWEFVRVLELREGQYDQRSVDKMRDRRFAEWLEDAKQTKRIEKDLSPQERQWALDRASKGIFETTDPNNPSRSSGRTR